ncbi:MAG: dockerin type I repeat-containing protein [Spirochaetales bacterium]|nr:dockerin type I repeat-containing protein [Spirochaetales bacterium]
MIKKEYFFVFVIAGLAVVYAILATVNFFTRGKIQRVLKKKLIIGTMLITFTSFMTIGSFAQNLSDPTPVYGTPVPVVEPVPEYGAVLTPDPMPLYGTPPPTPTPVYATPTATIEPQIDYGTPMIGDVNMDLRVNIVDALMVAQHYVGQTPTVFNPDYADVNQDQKINIVDALLIAQKYVGAIEEFPKKE